MAAATAVGESLDVTLIGGNATTSAAHLLYWLSGHKAENPEAKHGVGLEIGRHGGPL
jgi:hypothetical protein